MFSTMVLRVGTHLLYLPIYGVHMWLGEHYLWPNWWAQWVYILY